MSTSNPLEGLKSFSVTTLKHGGLRATLKVCYGDNKEGKITLTYEPKKTAKNFMLSAFGYSLKAKTRKVDDKIVVDLKLPADLAAIILIKTGKLLSANIHLELDIDRPNADTYRIDFETEIGGNPLKLTLHSHIQEASNKTSINNEERHTIVCHYDGRIFTGRAHLVAELRIDPSAVEYLNEVLK